MADTSESDITPLPSRFLTEALELWRDSTEHGLVQVVGDNSMLPMIRSGDFLLVEPDCANIRRGDIMVFRFGHELVTHRVISLKDEESGLWYVTKGDNRLWADPDVAASEIIGRVLAIKRGNRHFDLDNRTWRIASWLIGCTMLLWIRTAGTARSALHSDRLSIPRQVTSPLGASIRMVFSVWLRTLELLFGRWRA